MPDRTYTYRVQLETGDINAKAEQIRAMMLRLFSGVGATNITGQFQAQLADQQAAVQAAANAEMEAQRQMTVIARAETAERSQVARAEASERVEAARQASIALAENERRFTVELTEAERRRTALFRQELRERERSQRQAEMEQSRTNIGGTIGKLDNLAGLAVGGVAAFGTVQALQAAYRAANEGAQQLRFADVFENQAKRVGVSANAMLMSIEEASNGTIRESQAMALGAQLLSQRFVATNAEIAAGLADDTAVVTAFSRRAAQIFTDESGAALSTQEVYARLIKYVREGNKELVDQFGLSNQLIADALNIPIEGLAGPDGAAQRWRGLVTVLGQEMERLGTGSDTAADRMERASARIANSTDRIKQALAPVAANVAESTANFIERMSVLGGNTDMGALIRTTKEQIGLLQEMQAKQNDPSFLTSLGGKFEGAINFIGDPQEQIQRAQQLLGVMENFGHVPALDAFKEQIQSIAKELNDWGKISDDSAGTLGMLSDVSTAYGNALQIVDAATIQNNSAIQSVIEQSTNLEERYRTGQIGVMQYQMELSSLNRELVLFRDGMKSAEQNTQSMTDALTDLVNKARSAGDGLLANIVLSKGTSAETFASDMATTGNEMSTFDALMEPVRQAKQRIAQELLSASLKSVTTLGAEEAKQRLDEALAVLDTKFGQIETNALKGQGVPNTFDLAQFGQQLETQLMSTFTVFDSFNTEKERIRGDLQDAALNLVDSIGLPRAIDLIRQQGYDLDAAFAALPEGLKGEDLIAAVAKIRSDILKPLEDIGSVADVKKDLQSKLQDAAVGLVADIGVDKAAALLKQQQAVLDQELGKLFEGMDPADLAIMAEAIAKTILAPFEKVKEELNSNLSDIGVDSALSQISQALEQLNTGAYDFVPGITEVRSQLYELYDAILATGQVTDDQASQLSALTAEAWAAGDSTMFYKDMVTALGEKFFEQNDAASGVVDQMIKLQAAYDSGKISAEEHAGALSVLVQMLKDIAIAAGISGKALDDAFASAEHFLAIDVARFGSTPGYKKGVELGGSLGAVVKSQSDSTDRAEERREAQRTAKSAASEYEQALKRGAQAVEDAAQELQRKLDKIPGLMGTSQVTDQQMRMAKAGVPQNFVDNWRRRLEDEVKNGKDWEGVSIEQAKEALQRVGVALANSSEGILEQFNAAWADSSLFADKANLGLIDQEAVQAQLDLQEKIKTGQQNIYDLFGATVDQVNEAVASGKLSLDGVSVVGGNKVAASIDGKPVDATLEPKLKALSVSNTAIVQVQKDIEEKVKPVLTFDFGTEALAKLAGSINGAIANDKTKADFTGFGVTLADYIGSGFDGRTSELSWLAPIWAKMKYEVLEAIYGEDTQQ